MTSPPQTTADHTLHERGLAAILELEQVGPLAFRAHHHQANQVGALFGGSVLGQAMQAAALSRPDRIVHSLHGYFLRAGSPHEPLDLAVEALLDGGSFSTRRVTATQGGPPLFVAEVSMQAPSDRPGYAHVQGWSEPPADPDSLPNLRDLATLWSSQLPPGVEEKLWLHPHLEVRPLQPEDLLLRKAPPRFSYWMRVLGPPLPEALHGPGLAFASDYLLSAASIIPYREALFESDLLAASLDHAMWFHAPVGPGEWLLHEAVSTWAGGGRALNQGRLYTREGRLIASTAQELLIRDRRAV